MSDLTSVQQPINGADGETFARPEVVMVNGCTGTMISRQEVVTAAHCFDHCIPGLGHARNAGVVTMFPGPGQAAQTRNIVRVICQGGGGTRDDIATARIEWPFTNDNWVPAQIAESTPPPHHWRSIVGFGATCRSCTDGGVKRYKDYWDNGGSTEHGNPGDSGAPIFLGRLLDGGAIVRLHQGPWWFPGLDDHDVYADPVFYRHHILAAATAIGSPNIGISYRAHAQDNGWLPSVFDGWTTGVAGKRIEAMNIWSPAPGISVCYQGHIQGLNDQAERCDGDGMGTTGQGRRLEAFRLYLRARPAGVTGIRYTARVNGQWQPWSYNGAWAGTKGKGLAIDQVQIALY